MAIKPALAIVFAITLIALLVIVPISRVKRVDIDPRSHSLANRTYR